MGRIGTDWTALQTGLAFLAGLTASVALVVGLAALTVPIYVLVFAALGALSLVRFKLPYGAWVDFLLFVFGISALLWALPAEIISEERLNFGADYWLSLVSAWLFGWLFVERISRLDEGTAAGKISRYAIPVLFGMLLLLVWELLVRGAQVPTILLPPPSMIGARIAVSLGILWADFQQTFLKSVLAGYVMGCSAGFFVAIAIDRSPFLKRGMLPLGNFVAALPIIGIAPIMVNWYGFDWQSKAAVVAVMTFFPMLVNSVTGLSETGRMDRDLMRTYAANYWQSLLFLRLPAAGPFIFNALKINTTLALIGAIVAEFFGTPVVGMGFRISTEVGRLNVDMVWAEIAVAALAGSTFYGLVALVERAVTFWHPSVRNERA